MLPGQQNHAYIYDNLNMKNVQPGETGYIIEGTNQNGNIIIEPSDENKISVSDLPGSDLQSYLQNYLPANNPKAESMSSSQDPWKNFPIEGEVGNAQGRYPGDVSDYHSIN
ncbi:hypothetical protein ACOZ4N_00490 (plasmid) [Halorientalis pallida]|uniref:hypothetical protein n=1 Tax=Halorientalis pallida TaxID=2479928 RepID=UPI003C6EE9F0